MENVIHRLTLDLAGPDTIPRVEVQQDNARSLSISLTQGGRPYWIAEGVTAVFSGRKPDGKPLFNACTIEKNRVVYDFTDQTTNVAGIVECEILLYSGDERILASPRFELAIDELIHKDGDVPESAPELNALTQMVAAGTAMLEDLREALGELGDVSAILEQARSAVRQAQESADDAGRAATAAVESRQEALALAGQAHSASQQANKYAYEASNHAKAAEEAAERAEEAAAGAGGGGTGDINDAIDAHNTNLAAHLNMQNNLNGLRDKAISEAIGSHSTDSATHADIRNALEALRNRVNAALNSDDVTLDQTKEIVAYIKSNKALIDAITTSKVSVADIVDNLVTNVTNKPLSAAMGVALSSEISSLDSKKLDANKLDSAIDTSLARAKASGVFDGEDGKDGVGISGASINAEGQLVITYSDGKTVNLDKVVGMNGKDGVGISKSEINASGELVITYTNGQQVNLGGVIGAAGKDGTDGKDGKTPVKGVDYFTPADKAELAGMVLEVLQGKVISGYVAEDGSIVINGLPDGNYTVKYEMADGSTLKIGELVLDTRVYYSVTGNLSNCVSSNSAVSVAQGDSYKTTITAVSGYELESVTVTMGGVDITAQAVSGGSISIAGVTGDVVITVVAVSAGPGYTNLAQPDPDATGEAAWNAGGWCNGSYIAGSSYAYRGSTDMTRVTTNVFEVESGDTIYVKGIKCTDGTDALIALLNADSGRIYNSTVAITANNSYISQVSYIDGSDYWSFRNSGGTGADHGTRFIRLAGYLSGGVNDVVITRNQPIE